MLEGVEVPPDFIKENFVNHSCDGNAWFVGDDKLIACRKIKKGEEIAYVIIIEKIESIRLFVVQNLINFVVLSSYDYALTESSKFFKLNCLVCYLIFVCILFDFVVVTK
jgi:hypothetical protein